MVRVKVKIRMGYDILLRVLEHLRYAGVIEIEELPEDNSEYVEFVINPPKGVYLEDEWAERISERIKSFGDHAEAVYKP